MQAPTQSPLGWGFVSLSQHLRPARLAGAQRRDAGHRRSIRRRDPIEQSRQTISRRSTSECLHYTDNFQKWPFIPLFPVDGSADRPIREPAWRLPAHGTAIFAGVAATDQHARLGVAHNHLPAADPVKAVNRRQAMATPGQFGQGGVAPALFHVD